MATVPQQEVRVTLGVDTHEDVHVAVALDQLGRYLGGLSVPTHRGGFARLIAWASQLGVVDKIGVEGTGSWGAGLARWLRAEGLVVVEVDRPDRKTRRRGKSDPIDAEAAARAVLSGKATAVPKTGDGPVEMIRVLRLTRRSAVKNRTMTANQLSAVVTTAPDALREQLRGLSIRKRVALAAKFRTGEQPDTVLEVTRYALRELARRYQHLTEQIARLDAQLDRWSPAPPLTWSPRLASEPTPLRLCWSPPATTLSGSRTKDRSPTSRAARPLMPPPASSYVTVSTAGGTATPTPPCIRSPSPDCQSTRRPSCTSSGASRREKPKRRHSAVSNATSPERSTRACHTTPP